jgi:hypothetical protein
MRNGSTFVMPVGPPVMSWVAPRPSQFHAYPFVVKLLKISRKKSVTMAR